jgi:hypothetical protein
LAPKSTEYLASPLVTINPLACSAPTDNFFLNMQTWYPNFLNETLEPTFIEPPVYFPYNNETFAYGYGYYQSSDAVQDMAPVAETPIHQSIHKSKPAEFLAIRETQGE